MSFRAKLLIVIVVTVVASVGLVAWTVSSSTRRAFEELESQRTAALVEQFRREFARRGADVDNRVHGIAESEATLRMAIDLSRPNPDYSLYVTDSRGLALSHQLDFVELAEHDGVIFSSSHWPGRFGTRNEWVSPEVDWKALGAFLKREDFPAEGDAEGGAQAALMLVAVRTVGVGERKIFVIGGKKLDKDFLASLVLPAGMRALLYRNLEPVFSPGSLLSAAAPVEQPEKLASFIERVRRNGAEETDTVTWSADPASAETFHALPVKGRAGELLGILLVGSSRRELVEMQEFIRAMALVAGAFGLLLGVAISWWAAARVTRPVEKLAHAARAVAAGDWSTQVKVRSRDEIGELARSFNQMTQQLSEQRERLVQAERVAAWRELARRLAHELKNPLYPLQITIENLQRAREHSPEQFDEVFRESTATLLAELENLKGIVARFSDFAKMPAPQLQPVNVNELVRSAVRLFESQFSAPGRPQVLPELYFEENIATIQADPEQLRRALQNLVLNAQDAMPAGGTLTIRTKNADGGVRIEVSDTGSGLTPEECARLFTPYYTTKHYGTGLGLAIVQSVVSDHAGKISVESEEGRGTTFRIELPAKPREFTTPSAAVQRSRSRNKNLDQLRVAVVPEERSGSQPVDKQFVSAAENLASLILEKSAIAATEIEQWFGFGERPDDALFREIFTEFSILYLHLCDREADTALEDRRPQFIDTVFWKLNELGTSRPMNQKHPAPAFKYTVDGIEIVGINTDLVNQRQTEYGRMSLFPAMDKPMSGTVFWECAKHVGQKFGDVAENSWLEIAQLAIQNSKEIIIATHLTERKK